MFKSKISKKLGGVFSRKQVFKRKQVSANALKVLNRLDKSGYDAFLVGGAVRDVLLGMTPKDSDVVTNASPEEVRKVFRNSRMIGRRFRIVHVYFPQEIIEVSTFRANISEENPKADEMPEMIKRDNEYGTIEEDAWRRDFTVNALYFNFADGSIVDYTGGMDDLKKGMLRMIGDPVQRYHEDPVRMLRALRLAAKLNLKIEPKTLEPIDTLKHLLSHVPPSRLFDETLKLFFTGFSEVTYRKLEAHGFIQFLYPQIDSACSARKNRCDAKLIDAALKATDYRLQNGKSINPAFLMSIFLWPAFQKQLHEQLETGARLFEVLHDSIDAVLREQDKTVVISKRLKAMIRSIWVLQFHLEKRRGKRVWRTLRHRYFRAAYDFLGLRAESGEPFQELHDWWTKIQAVDEDAKHEMIQDLSRHR